MRAPGQVLDRQKSSPTCMPTWASLETCMSLLDELAPNPARCVDFLVLYDEKVQKIESNNSLYS